MPLISKEKVPLLILCIYIAAMLVFALLSTATTFHDTTEYILLARELAGHGNAKAFSSHSLLYSFMTVPFIWAWQSMSAIKLFNVMWVILTSLLLWFAYRDKKAFFLWAFCPLAWIVSIQTTPILPATFFFLAAYLAFKKWEESKKALFFVLSAISGGMAFAVYIPSIIFLGIFLLGGFYKKRFSETFWFVLIALVPVLLRVIIDYSLTGIVGYSFIRYVGANLVVLLGINQLTSPIQGILYGQKLLYYLIVVISPLLFMIYKAKYKGYKVEIWMIVVTMLFFLVRGDLIKYFLPITPLILIILAGVLDRKKIIIGSAISLVLIIVFTAGYFGHNVDYNNNQDIKLIIQDFQYEELVAPANIFANIWDGKTRFFWPEDYFMAKNNDTYFVKYSIESEPKINLYKQLELKVSLKRHGTLTIPADTPHVRDIPLEGFSTIKCYDVLCVFNPGNSSS